MPHSARPFPASALVTIRPATAPIPERPSRKRRPGLSGGGNRRSRLWSGAVPADRAAATREVRDLRGGEDRRASRYPARGLHLAAKLPPGEACPVCGSLDHPAPANSQIEKVGLDRAFREAKAASERAEGKCQRATGELAAAEGALIRSRINSQSCRSQRLCFGVQFWL